MLGVEHLVAEPRRGEAQQLGAVARLGLAVDQRVRGLDAELRLGGARRRPAPQPRELLAHEHAAALLARRSRCGRARRARARTRRSRRRTGARRRRTTSHVLWHDRVEEPAVVGDDEQRAAAGRPGGAPASRRPRRRGGWSARRAAAARAPSSSSRASAMRRRSPPDSGAIGVSIPASKRRSPTPPSRPSRTSRNALSAIHSWSARSPTSSARIVLAGSRSSPWPSSASTSPPARVSAPASGSSMPATSSSSVDLPSPLRPTTPIRSPAATPSVIPRSTERLP